jgi:hypothetical protein
MEMKSRLHDLIAVLPSTQPQQEFGRKLEAELQAVMQYSLSFSRNNPLPFNPLNTGCICFI